jgi:xanthine dehydrogenase large subunit
MAHKSRRSVLFRLARADDMTITGKRHDFLNRYEAGFDDEGRLCAVNFSLAARCGFSPDLSDAIVDRAMFHADNAYYLSNAVITGHRAKTDTVSNTAFRGFGGPQGIMAVEQLMDDIALTLQKDPLEIRKINLYGLKGRHLTPYHQEVDQLPLREIIEKLEKSSDYQARREGVAEFNRQNTLFKKGIALTPVKFGISFTVTHLNQAGALVHVYSDGSVHLNHGGTEMGQGLFIKVAQVVADELGVTIDRIGISSTRTDKVPNTSATAASSGLDLNAFAAKKAAQIIKARLVEFASKHFVVSTNDIVLENNLVHLGKREIAFSKLANLAYLHRVPLSATGFYQTPKIYYDRNKAQGRPFFYYATGAAVSEVVIDTLTGENRVLRVDILHDVGQSINPAIDRGQIEGGFVQGMGWLTCEEVVWDARGRYLSGSPATYKIPAIGDTPPIFNVQILEGYLNPEETIYHSKAVGEPPLMLAISVWSAIRWAVASCADNKLIPKLKAPATPENVLMAVDELMKRKMRS